MPNGRKINKDSHLALTEHVTGKKVAFPKGRFEKPIVMKPDSYPWVGDRTLEGVEHKRLGMFGGSATGRAGPRAPGAVRGQRRAADRVPGHRRR